MNYATGCLLSPPDSRDYSIEDAQVAKLSVVNEETYPTSFMIDYLPAVYNQGSVGSCVAHSLAEIKEIQDRIEFDDADSADYRCSVGFIYANRDATDYQGEGMVPRQALKQLQKVGTCKQSEFPYNLPYSEIVSVFNAQSNLESLKENAIYKSIKTYYKISTLNELKYTLMNVGPVLLSVPYYADGWDRETGKIQVSGTNGGGHAIVAIGWEDDNTIIFRNSWGTGWGLNGNGSFVFGEYPVNEMWAVTDRTAKDIQEILDERGHEHSFTKWETIEEPTCRQVGKARSVCECGVSTEKELPMLEHSFDEWVKTSVNNKTHVINYRRECLRCGRVETKSESYTPWYKVLLESILKIINTIIKHK